MTNTLERRLEGELEQFIRDGVYKRLNFLDSPQGPRVKMEGRGEVIILSSNNYLGLCGQAEVIEAGKAALDRWGAGTASVRFICGTFIVHRALENACARLVGTPASLSFVSAWNANEAVPATLLGEEDIVISDQLNHASIIDGVRLAKAITKCQTAVYKHSDLGRPGGEADRGARPSGAAGDHRRRVLDGGLDREASRPVGGLPQAPRGAHGGRLAWDRRARRHRTRHGGAPWGRGRRGHHHFDARQGSGRRGRRLRRRLCGGVRAKSFWNQSHDVSLKVVDSASGSSHSDAEIRSNGKPAARAVRMTSSSEAAVN